MRPLFFSLVFFVVICGVSLAGETGKYYDRSGTESYHDPKKEGFYFYKDPEEKKKEEQKKEEQVEEKPQESKATKGTVPSSVLVYRMTGEHISVGVGVVTLGDLTGNIHKGVRYLRGEITAEQFTAYERRRLGDDKGENPYQTCGDRTVVLIGPSAGPFYTIRYRRELS